MPAGWFISFVVLLPADGPIGLPVGRLHHQRGDLRLVLSQHAQVGGHLHDRDDHPAPDAGVFHRCLSGTARVELGGRDVPVATTPSVS